MGIALAMDWERPYWAGLAVIVCSFAATGDSLNKGLLRIGGTLLAVVVSLVLVGLAPQDRWLFFLLMTAWLVLCGYLSAGSSRGYVWTCAGFSVPILALGGGLESAASFNTVILRAQETGLGILVYSLVSYLLWPTSSRGPFEGAVAEVIEAERQVGRYLLGLMAGRPEDDTAAEMRGRAAPILSRLPAMLDGAEMDSAEIWGRRGTWRRLIGELDALREALERWHGSIADVKGLDLERLLPGLQAFGARLERRFDVIATLLENRSAGDGAVAVASGPADSGLDRGALGSLSHFDRAALIACVDQMQRVDRLSAALLGRIAAARALGDEPEPDTGRRSFASRAVFDPDRFLYALRTFTTVWMAVLIGIYVPDVPDATVIICVAASLCISLVLMPQVSPTIAQGPVSHALLFAGSVYMFLMPHLSRFTELAVLLFVAVFGIAYVFHQPAKFLSRTVWLCVFVLVIGLADEQTYSFYHVAGMSIALFITIGLVTVGGYFPISYQPGERFGHQLRRFFRSCAFLVGDSEWTVGRRASWLDEYRSRFHSREVATLPVKMAVWCPGVQSLLGGSDSAALKSVLSALQAIRYRVVELHSARSALVKRSRTLPDEFRAELIDWRSTLGSVFEQLAANPRPAGDTRLEDRLPAKIRALEDHVERLMNGPAGERWSDAEEQGVYRLLAAAREVSDGLVAYEREARALDWRRLRESRF